MICYPVSFLHVLDGAYLYSHSARFSGMDWFKLLYDDIILINPSALTGSVPVGCELIGL